jgi:hypothetical protein
VPDDPLASRVTVLEQRVDRLEASIADFRAEVAASFYAVHQALIQLDANYRELRTQADRNHSQMLALHEDVIARISTLGELWTRRRPNGRKKR